MFRCCWHVEDDLVEELIVGPPLFHEDSYSRLTSHPSTAGRILRHKLSGYLKQAASGGVPVRWRGSMDITITALLHLNFDQEVLTIYNASLPEGGSGDSDTGCSLYEEIAATPSTWSESNLSAGKPTNHFRGLQILSQVNLREIRRVKQDDDTKLVLVCTTENVCTPREKPALASALASASVFGLLTNDSTLLFSALTLAVDRCRASTHARVHARET